MKKISFLFVFILFLILFSSCSTKEKPEPFKNIDGEIKYEADQEYLSFEGAIEHATDIAVATFKAYHEYEHYTELEFSISKTLKGETAEDTIYVFEVITGISATGDKNVSYTTGQYNFIPNHDYILILEREKSIYYDHDRYTMLGEIFLPLDDNIGFYMYNQPIEEFSNQSKNKISTTNSIVNLIKDLSKTANNQLSYYGEEYSTSEDLQEILVQSDYIVRVTIDELMIEGILNDTQTFSGSIIELLKGEFFEEEINEWGDEIYIVFNKDEAVVGEEYLLLLNRTDPQSRMFIQSSKNSVHHITNEAEAKSLYDELGL